MAFVKKSATPSAKEGSLLERRAKRQAEKLAGKVQREFPVQSQEVPESAPKVQKGKTR